MSRPHRSAGCVRREVVQKAGCLWYRHGQVGTGVLRHVCLDHGTGADCCPAAVTARATQSRRSCSFWAIPRKRLHLCFGPIFSRKKPNHYTHWRETVQNAGMVIKVCAVLIQGATFLYVMLFKVVVFSVSLFACHTVSSVRSVVLPGSATTIANLGPKVQAFELCHAILVVYSGQERSWRHQPAGPNLLDASRCASR